MAARKPTNRKKSTRRSTSAKANAQGRTSFVSIPVAREALEWIEALYASGALVIDRKGGARFTPAVKQLLDALHEALAGGKVTVSIASRGESARRSELDGKLTRALEATNFISSTTGAEVFSP